MVKVVQPLPDGPLDIIGDVHGELEALQQLLHRLGVDVERRRATRPIVFVGDLVDRGPDSIGVVQVVQRLVDAGLAYAVVGNHELNVMRNQTKEGNGWFHGDDTDHFQINERKIRFGSRLADAAQRQQCVDFFNTLPLVLQRDDLQVVHAGMDEAALRQLPEQCNVAQLCSEIDDDIVRHLSADGTWQRSEQDKRAFSKLRVQSHKPDRHLHEVGVCAVTKQVRNPIKILTSGLEELIEEGSTYWAGGQWRFARRSDWWRQWRGRPTVVGHYWRMREPLPTTDVFADYGATGWANGVFCVDYSAGRRYEERAQGTATGFHRALAALRWPERVVQFDDTPAPVATTGFG